MNGFPCLLEEVRDAPRTHVAASESGVPGCEKVGHRSAQGFEE